MRGFALAAALMLCAATSRAHEAIVRVDDLDTTIRGYADLQKWPLLHRGKDDARVRIVKLTPADAPIPMSRIPFPDIVAAHEIYREHIVSDLQIARYGSLGASRALVIAQNGAHVELYQPGAQPMTEQELKEFTAKGRFSTWTRFNNKLTGTVVWRPDGSAHVKWTDGTLDEEGTWTIRGDTVCTAWFRLREGRELCVQHYRLFGDTTQSFRTDGTPDGIHSWKAAGQLE